jgi:uncharacterized Zn-finger protein
MLLLKCPKCGNQMKYQQVGILNRQKRKACVYCGKSFQVTDHIVQKT